jgi:hypothetical protein
MTPPAAPLVLSATAGDKQATVSWAVPDNGGSPITSYTVQPIQGGTLLAPITVFPPTTVATVTGLSNGLSYTFNVSATNAIGTGPASTSGLVTPFGPPLGIPNNDPATAVSLGLVPCGGSAFSPGNPVTANDGSNAWYTVTFTGPASLFNTACSLSVTLGGGAVFDIHPGSASNPALATGVTSWSSPQPLAFGGPSQLYFIRVYDPTPGAVVLLGFGLSVGTF